MEPRTFKRSNPETKLTNDIRDALHKQGWHTEKIHGSAFQMGLPDLYITKVQGNGIAFNKWVEVKIPTRRGNVFTPAQLKKFPVLSRNGTQIYVLTSVSDIPLLMEKPNWHKYLQYTRLT